MRLLFLGDIVGRSGRNAVIERLPGLIDRYKLDFVVINGENAAGGFGITEEIVRDVLDAGADVITTGNHAFDQREALVFCERQPQFLRPVNYPMGTPGRGANLFIARNGARPFDRNPLALLRPEICPDSLVSAGQKLQLLADTGVDATLMLTFDRALADLGAREFVEHVLVGALGVRIVLVGADFRFGRGGAGNPELLRELGAEFGFEVDVIEDVRAIDEGRRVSSTWVRELLSGGDVAGAARLLGRPHAVRGEVVHGLKRGRELGFPTANLAADLEGFVPAEGVYAGWLVDGGAPGDGALNPRSSVRYPAAISVGTNPTFDDIDVPQVEAYVLDETDLDLYGHVVDVEFVERIRGMVAFEGVEPLIMQMTDDVAQVRRELS